MKKTLPQVVLMPGLLCDASVFRHQIASLSDIASIKVADFSKDTSIENMALNALSLFDGPVVLIGFSMGGRAALSAVRQEPDRVASLCLMDTGSGPAREDEPAKRQGLIDLANQKGMKALAAVWLPPMLHPDREKEAALVEPLTEMVERATPAQHERQIKALLNRPDATDLLPKIQCPTLVMVGRQDRWSTLPQHEEMCAAISGAELVVIEESGHFAPVEQPAAVSAALRAWVQKVAAQ